MQIKHLKSSDKKVESWLNSIKNQNSTNQLESFSKFLVEVKEKKCQFFIKFLDVFNNASKEEKREAFASLLNTDKDLGLYMNREKAVKMFLQIATSEFEKVKPISERQQLLTRTVCHTMDILEAVSDAVAGVQGGSSSETERLDMVKEFCELNSGISSPEADHILSKAGSARNRIPTVQTNYELDEDDIMVDEEDESDAYMDIKEELYKFPIKGDLSQVSTSLTEITSKQELKGLLDLIKVRTNKIKKGDITTFKSKSDIEVSELPGMLENSGADRKDIEAGQQLLAVLEENKEKVGGSTEENLGFQKQIVDAAMTVKNPKIIKLILSRKKTANTEWMYQKGNLNEIMDSILKMKLTVPTAIEYSKHLKPLLDMTYLVIDRLDQLEEKETTLATVSDTKAAKPDTLDQKPKPIIQNQEVQLSIENEGATKPGFVNLILTGVVEFFANLFKF